ncbi:uncharacterized protein LOC142221789 [Haematobia irritans]|uniref:uncharacterized protein LOC142221789 n=1 Tax=Haematobia irritans TaxID=7368 RepID=UPI003F4FB2D7
MKQLTRLINYETKKSKTNFKTYNPFDTGGGASVVTSHGNFPTNWRINGNDDEMQQNNASSSSSSSRKMQTRRLEPKVHNKYQKTNESSSSSMAKMKTKGGHNTSFFTKSKSKQATASSSTCATSSSASLATVNTSTKSNRHPTSPTIKCNGNSINYTSLNRMRNSSNGSSNASQDMECHRSKQTTSAGKRHKRKWLKFLLWKCWRNRKRKSSQHLQQKSSKRRRCWSSKPVKFLVLLLQCQRCRNRVSSSSSYPYDSEDDDDIDAKFHAYVLEMKERDAREESALEKVRGERMALTAKYLPN